MSLWTTKQAQFGYLMDSVFKSGSWIFYFFVNLILEKKTFIIIQTNKYILQANLLEILQYY